MSWSPGQETDPVTAPVCSPAATTRGFKEREFEQIADLVADVLDANGIEAAIEKARAAASELCRRYPVYGP